MRPDLEAKRLLDTIKKIMGVRRIKYRDLAAALGISLPTVKRLLNKEEIQLSQLLKICRWLDMTVPELFEQASHLGADVFKFTPEQESFFASSPHYLAYLFALYNEGLAPTEIQQLHGISQQSTRKYLRKLQELNLIDVFPGDRVKVLIHGAISWGDHGRLGQVFSKSMVESFAKRAVQQLGPPESLSTWLYGWSLTKQNVDELIHELNDLARRFRQTSAYNRKVLRRTDYDSFSCMVLLDKWEDDLFKKIQEL